MNWNICAFIRLLEVLLFVRAVEFYVISLLTLLCFVSFYGHFRNLLIVWDHVSPKSI